MVKFVVVLRWFSRLCIVYSTLTSVYVLLTHDCLLAADFLYAHICYHRRFTQ